MKPEHVKLIEKKIAYYAAKDFGNMPPGNVLEFVAKKLAEYAYKLAKDEE